MPEHDGIPQIEVEIGQMELTARGGMSDVFKAQATILGQERTVACKAATVSENDAHVKMLDCELTAFKRYFKGNSRFVQILDEEVVTIKDSNGQERQSLVYEWLGVEDGYSTMNEVLSDNTQPLTNEDKIFVVKELAQVFADLKSAEVFLRDFDPKQIFLQREPQGKVVGIKIGDYGGTVWPEVRNIGTNMGKAGFAAWEAHSGDMLPENYGEAQEIFSVATTIFNLLTSEQLYYKVNESGHFSLGATYKAMRDGQTMEVVNQQLEKVGLGNTLLADAMVQSTNPSPVERLKFGNSVKVLLEIALRTLENSKSIPITDDKPESGFIMFTDIKRDQND